MKVKARNSYPADKEFSCHFWIPQLSLKMGRKVEFGDNSEFKLVVDGRKFTAIGMHFTK